MVIRMDDTCLSQTPQCRVVLSSEDETKGINRQQPFDGIPPSL